MLIYNKISSEIAKKKNNEQIPDRLKKHLLPDILKSSFK